MSRSTVTLNAFAICILLICYSSPTALRAQESPRQLDQKVTEALEMIGSEFEVLPSMPASFFDEKMNAACPAIDSTTHEACPNGCSCERQENCPDCPALRSEFAVSQPPLPSPPVTVGFVPNEHYQSQTLQLCDELSATIAECLADSNIPVASREKVLKATMKLLVRNAELESLAKLAKIQLEHEREMASLRGEYLQLQTRMASTGEIKTWMGPLYTNQNQTQQQINNLVTNLQLVNRTLRLLEKEKEQVERRQANQPLPTGYTAPQNSQPRPERWSQLPNHAMPTPQRQQDLHDKTTRAQPSKINGNTFSQAAPPRLTDEAVRRQQLESYVRQIQAELDRTGGENSSAVRPAAWEQPAAAPKPMLPNRQPLRPMIRNRTP